MSLGGKKLGGSFYSLGIEDPGRVSKMGCAASPSQGSLMPQDLPIKVGVMKYSKEGIQKGKDTLSEPSLI